MTTYSSARGFARATPRLPHPLTPESLRGLMRQPAYSNPRDPRFPTYQRLVKRGFEILYPGPERRDDTGMAINTPPLPPERVAPLVEQTNREMAAMDEGLNQETGSEKTHDGMVHVESHVRDGGKVEVSDYWRAAPGQGAGHEGAPHHSAGTDGPKTDGDSTMDTPRKPDNTEFLDGISRAEQSHDKPDEGYSERNPVSNELGRYQIKPNTLDGIKWRNPDGTWTEKAGEYGVATDADFLNNPKAQEAAAKDMLRQYEKEAKGEGLYDRIGQKIEGKKGEIKITEAGIIAATHAEGATGTRRYMEKIEAVDFKSKDLPLTEKEARVETRLRIFQGVPYRRASNR